MAAGTRPMDVNPRGFQIQLDVGETSSNSGQGFEESDGSMRSESNEVFPSFHSSDGNNSNSRGDGSLFVVALGADEAAPTVPFTDDDKRSRETAPKQGGHKKPRNNFTAEEDDKIRKGAAASRSWDAIALELGTNRTARSVLDRFNRKLKPNVSSSPNGSSSTQQPGTTGNPIIILTNSPNNSIGPVAEHTAPQTEKPKVSQRKIDEHFGAKRKASTLSVEESLSKQRKMTEMTATPTGNFNPAATASSLIPVETSIEQLREIRAEREKIEEERSKARDWKKLLEEKERELKLREERNDAKDKELAERDRLGDAWKARAMESLRSHLKENELLKRREAKEAVQRDMAEIGSIGHERHGMDMVEVWIDGEKLKAIKLKQMEVQQQMDDIEALKKTAAKKKTATDSIDENAFMIQQEIFRSKKEGLKKQLDELAQEKEGLLVRRSLHIKEMKRIQDEEHSPFNSFPLLQNRYLMLQLLGKGGFSEVYKAFDLQELRLVACKIHQLIPHWSEQKKANYTKHACREYNIHKSIIHPRIVQLFDVFEIDANTFCTVLEYCNGGDLDTHLKMHQCLTEKESKLILAQVFEGLKYLNLLKRPVIHYDLKPGNILFDEFGGVKITDFGLSKIMEENSQDMDLTSQGAGTYWYLPPECFETGRVPPKISSKVDVWSAGVMFYQMLFGKKPFANNVSQQKILQENLIGRDVTLEFPTKTPSNNKVSEEAKTFLRSCLIADQEARPDVLKICEHSYLAMSKTKTKMPPPKTPRTTSKTSVFGVSSGSLSDLDDV